MRGPSFNIAAIDRRSGLGTYQPDLSQMPQPPAGYQYQVIPGQIFPQLVKVQSTSPLEMIAIFGVAVFAGWMFFGKKKLLPSM